MRWRLIENKWNMKDRPWRGAVGIEEDNDAQAVPVLICWFVRGIDPAIPQAVVDAHNDSLTVENNQQYAKTQNGSDDQKYDEARGHDQPPSPATKQRTNHS